MEFILFSYTGKEKVLQLNIESLTLCKIIVLFMLKVSFAMFNKNNIDFQL